MKYNLIGQLPKHLYIYVDSTFTHKESIGFIPAIWYGLVSYPNRMWGCTVLLECGAIYRNLPPHAIAFSEKPEINWTKKQSQTWNCYGNYFSCIEYSYLNGLNVVAKADKKDYKGKYLFTVAPVDDGFSAFPEQAKEFSFVQLNNGRLTIQPTNYLLIIEKSFTINKELKFPTELKIQKEVFSCE